MPLILFFLFIVWPVTELWLLFKLNGVFGFLPTVLLVFGTGILGAWLAKWQGLQAIIRLQNEIRQGVMPAQAIGDGALILVAGVLLITPGALSDVAGILLLIPPVRKIVLAGVSRWFANHVRVQTTGFWQVSDGRLPGDDTVRDPSTVVEARVIETKVEDEK
jgi:UPF0716 protein FxsA